MPATILIAGARGIMGRRIAALCARHIPDCRIVRATRRRPDTNAGDAWRRADIFDAESLADALADVDVFINAVGPYTYDPAPILACCAAAKAHYIDIAEPPAFLARIENLATAAADSPAVVGGCSTVPALVQVIVGEWREAMGRGDIVRVEALLSMGSRNEVSATLLESLLAPLGQRGPHGGRYFSRLDRRLRGPEFSRLLGRYPSPVEEVGLDVGDGRRVPFAFFVGFDRWPINVALCAASRLIPLIPGRLLSHLSRVAAPFAGLSGLLGTRHGVLAVRGFSADGTRVRETQIHAFREGLNVPAFPAVWAARALLKESHARGWTTLPTLISTADATAFLRDEGCEVRQILAADGPVSRAE